MEDRNAVVLCRRAIRWLHDQPECRKLHFAGLQHNELLPDRSRNSETFANNFGIL